MKNFVVQNTGKLITIRQLKILIKIPEEKDQLGLFINHLIMWITLLELAKIKYLLNKQKIYGNLGDKPTYIESKEH